MMKKAVSLLLSVALIFCSGCTLSLSPKVYDKTFFCMDTVMILSLYTSSKNDAEEAFELCQKEALRLENMLSTTIAASEISRLNASEGQSVALSEDTAKLLKLAVDISEKTEGAFDITVYPLTRLWGFSSGEYKLPSNDEIQATISLIGANKLSLNGTQATLSQGSGVDLGAIAKGYLGDRLTELCLSAGIESGVLSLGGNVVLIGDKPEKDDLWSVAIRSPFNTSEYYCSLKLNGSVSVVTSGAYERSFESNGVTYHHIIDTKTGYPAESDLASVTVIGESGALCDALSTALFVMGSEKALAFLAENKELRFVLITKQGELLASSSLEGYVYELKGEIEYLN